MIALSRPMVAVALVLSLAACGKKARPLVQADLAASKVTTIGVNSYLWRASLDAICFMPLLQTDSNGGVIVTDWYVNPEQPGR
jgi:predicted small lipoprotein YifL